MKATISSPMVVDDAPNRLRAVPGARLGGWIAMPGDKSISHRALILGALADGETRIHGLLESEDVLHTARATAKFGAEVRRSDDGIWHIGGSEWQSPREPVDCGNSGTAARLLMGAAAGFPIEATFTGDASLRRRPMARVLDPLRAMGVRTDAGDTLPATIHGGGLGGISFRNVHASAQVKSAILLAGLRAAGPVEVIEPLPTRDHTEQMLRHFGCDVEISDEADGRHVRLGDQRRLAGREVFIPGDPSSAAFPIIAALVTPGSEITVGGVVDSPLRSGLLATLKAMGANLESTNRRRLGGVDVADITARASALVGTDVPATCAPAMIDEFPALAVAAAFARGRTVMHGLGELRHKESDRLAAIVEGLNACGVEARTDGDTLIVEGCGGPPPGGGSVRTHGDHRIAMAFVALGLAARQPVTVDSAEMIATSFPGFAELMGSIGARIEEVGARIEEVGA